MARLREGDAVIKESRPRAIGSEIEAPAGAYAFVAAQYLQQAAPAPAIVAAAASEPKTNNAPHQLQSPRSPNRSSVAPAPVDAPPTAEASSDQRPAGDEFQHE